MVNLNVDRENINAIYCNVFFPYKELVVEKTEI